MTAWRTTAPGWRAGTAVARCGFSLLCGCAAQACGVATSRPRPPPLSQGGRGVQAAPPTAGPPARRRCHPGVPALLPQPGRRGGAAAGTAGLFGGLLALLRCNRRVLLAAGRRCCPAPAPQPAPQRIGVCAFAGPTAPRCAQVVLVTQDKLFTLRAQEHGLRCVLPKEAVGVVHEAVARGSGEKAAGQAAAAGAGGASTAAEGGPSGPAAAAPAAAQAGRQALPARHTVAAAPASPGGLLPWPWAWPGGSSRQPGLQQQEQQRVEEQPVAEAQQTQQAVSGSLLSPAVWPPLSSAKAGRSAQPARPPLQLGAQRPAGAGQHDEGGSSTTVAVRAAAAAPSRRREKQQRRQQRRQEERRHQREAGRRRRQQQAQLEGAEAETPSSWLGGSLLQKVKGVFSAAKQLLSSPLLARSDGKGPATC